MKKTKNYLKILLFSIAFALSSCSKEMYEEPISEQKLQNLKAQKISLRDINSTKIDPLVFTAVNKVKNKQKSENGFNRMIYDPVFDFYYDDENGTLIENGTYKSYTFQVVRPNGDDKLENIVFSKNENGIDFDTYLFKYDFTNQELETQSMIQLSTNEVEIKSLDNNVGYPSGVGDWIETTEGRAVFIPFPCRWVRVASEPGGGHWECIDGSGGVRTLNIPALNPPPVRPPNPSPTPIPAIGTIPVVTNTTTPTGTTATVPTNSNTSTTSSTSSSSSSNSSASSNGTSGASGTTGTGINGTFETYGTNSAGTGVTFGGTNSGTSIITSPMGGGDDTNNSNPCKKLKKQHDKYPNLKQKLISLEATKNQNHENGIYIATNSEEVQDAAASTTASSTVNFPNLSPPFKFKVIAHTHDVYGPDGTGTFSIFSWGDLLEIADIIKDNENDDDIFTLYLATADNTRYALTIDWPSAFYEVFDVNTNPNNPSQTNYVDAKKLIELYNTEEKYYSTTTQPNKISYASSPEDDLKIFLQMMKDLKLSASLFAVDPTYSTFTKLNLTSNGLVNRAAPCN